MSVFSIFEDFEAMGIANGHIQSALADAWTDYSASGDISMRQFFKDRRETHPHRYANFAASEDNVSHAAFFSLSGQAAHVKEFGEAATRELLASQGLKLGQIRAPAKADPTKGENNPYDPINFKGTPAQREARLSSLIRSNATLASQLAKSCNRTIDNKPLQSVGAARMQRR